MPQVFSTTATLQGARDVNQIHLVTRQEDLGGKVQFCISALNNVTSAVSAINSWLSNLTGAVQQMMVCATSFSSALSTANFGSATASGTIALTSYSGNISNFRA